MKRTALALALAAAPLALPAQIVETGTGAVLRGLDKLSSELTDMEMPSGAEAVMGPLSIELRECRYPPSNPSGDAYAFVTIRDEGQQVFNGWMIASSPALNALDHPRYDIWLLRCVLP